MPPERITRAGSAAGLPPARGVVDVRRAGGAFAHAARSPMHRTFAGELRIRTHLLVIADEGPKPAPDTSPEPHDAMQQ